MAFQVLNVFGVLVHGSVPNRFLMATKLIRAQHVYNNILQLLLGGQTNTTKHNIHTHTRTFTKNTLSWLFA